MKTLILKHNGHEAHVPYEIPAEMRFACFVPGEGVCDAAVDLRSNAIHVIEVVAESDGGGYSRPEWCNLDAVLEQAGDVCAVFEHALGLSATAHFHESPEDVKVLSTIAEMALLESDLHTAWCRIPLVVSDGRHEPERDPKWRCSARMLERFVDHVLVPRAQDMATAAAKRREAEWSEQEALVDLHVRLARGDDLAIDLAKERA